MNDLQILQKLKGLPDPVAPLDSPHFTGEPTAPTPENTDASDKIATTSFVNAKVKADVKVVEDEIKQVKEDMSKYGDLDLDGVKEEIKKQLENKLSDEILDSLSTQTIKISYSDIGLRQENILKQIDAILTIINELNGDKALAMATYKAKLSEMRTQLINYYSTMNTAYDACINKTGTYADFSEKFQTWYKYTGEVLVFCQQLLNKLNAYLVGLKADATQQAIFNLLTDNGRMQGIYYADVEKPDGSKERQLFINGEYAQLKGAKVLDLNNNVTFEITKSGQVNINATSFKVTGRAIETLVSDQISSSDVMQDAVDKATSGFRTEIDNLTQKVNGYDGKINDVSTTVKDAIKDDIITSAEVASLKALYNDIAGRQEAVLKQINAVLSLSNIDNNDANSLKNYKTSVTNSYATVQEKYNAITSASKVTVQMFTDFDSAVTNWNNYVGIARSFCQTILNNIATKLTSEKLSATRQAVFNALTDNGRIKGIYMNEDELYINGDFIQTEDLVVKNSLIAEDVVVKKVNCAKVPEMLQAATEIYVNTSSGDDSNDFEDGAVFKTLQSAVNECPVCLNGKSARIYLQSDITEDIEIRGKTGGTLYIYLCNHKIYGTIKIWDCTGVLIYGGSSYTEDVADSNRGLIAPYSMTEMDSYFYSILAIRCTYIYLKDINVYGKVYNDNERVYTTQSKNYCIGATRGTEFNINNVGIVHSDNGCHAVRGGHIISQNSNGYAKRYGYYAAYGGSISICRSTAIGGASKNYASYDNEIIRVSDNVTFSSRAITQSSSAIKDSSTKIPTSDIVKSECGYSYRTSGNYKGSWSSDNVVRQGQYTSGYGMNKGFWFFGSGFDDYVGKTITKVSITLTRQAAGNYNSSATATLHYHGFKTKAAATRGVSSASSGPSVSTWSKALSVPAYSQSRTATFELTDSDLLNAISKGNCKGLALYNTSGSYQQYSGVLKVSVAYK